MRISELEALEAMTTENPSAADATMAQLVASANVTELSRIAGTSRTQSLRLRAIDALGQVGPAASDALTSLLKAAGAPLLEGGTEQRKEHEARRAALTQALARAGGGRGGRSNPTATT
jgi:hypothetical protein